MLDAAALVRMLLPPHARTVPLPSLLVHVADARKGCWATAAAAAAAEAAAAPQQPHTHTHARRARCHAVTNGHDGASPKVLAKSAAHALTEQQAVSTATADRLVMLVLTAVASRDLPPQARRVPLASLLEHVAFTG